MNSPVVIMLGHGWPFIWALIGIIVLPHMPDMVFHQDKVLLVLGIGSLFGVPVVVATNYRCLPKDWNAMARLIVTFASSFGEMLVALFFAAGVLYIGCGLQMSK
jgi:hypothetical protein